MALNPADAFGTMAAEYDSIARLGMPVYDEQLDAIEGCLLDGVTAVLELGCGTGALTLRLARRYPEAEIAAIDARLAESRTSEANTKAPSVALSGIRRPHLLE